MTNFTQMLGQVKEVQAKIQEAQQKVSHLQASGEAGAGLVKATVNGNKKLIKIEIDASIIQLDEQAMLQDLIIAAVNTAIENIEDKSKEIMQAQTAGMLGNLPLDFVL